MNTLRTKKHISMRQLELEISMMSKPAQVVVDPERETQSIQVIAALLAAVAQNEKKGEPNHDVSPASQN